MIINISINNQQYQTHSYPTYFTPGKILLQRINHHIMLVIGPTTPSIGAIGDGRTIPLLHNDGVSTN